jgi:peroxiredoxin Q/BCP
MAGTTIALELCLLVLSQAASESTATTPAAAAVDLPAGAEVPAFEALDQDGQTWKSSDHVGRKVVVLYFYPGDFTGGCIKQAEAFRAGLVRLEESGVELVGISGDSAETHRLFHETYGLKHTLLADPDGKVASLLGVPVSKGARVRTRGPDGKPLMDGQGTSIIVQRNVTLARWTLVIDRDGKIVSKRTQVDPAKDAEEVLGIVAELEKATSQQKETP